MSAAGWGQFALFFLLLAALAKPVGAYLFRVFEEARPLGRLEKIAYRICGVDPAAEQTWLQYTLALLIFSLFGIIGTYAVERLQGFLPFNPQHLPGVEPALAFNTAVSFVSNTNWQSYTPETTVSYFTQMAGLAWHNFTSAATGLGVALAVARGLTRKQSKTLGNFWVDVTRATLYVLLPLSALAALFFILEGVPQTLAPYQEIVSLEGVKQVLALGPVASQEAIKMLGTNGGGFFNANSAHPFENPNGLTNFVQMLLIFAIPAGLTFAYGRMARDKAQGWALFAAMAMLSIGGAAALSLAESQGNPALHGLLNLEGKETRFGIAGSSLFAAVTTQASCGAVNAMHDSLTALGGLVTMIHMQLGEVIFGGVGAGLYGMLIFVLLTVFIAGLMVGRTPEYLGKKIEAREMKLAMLYLLVFPFAALGFSALAAVLPAALKSLNNAGPHGLSEILYAFSSGAANNGSAFAGLNANTAFYNWTLSVDMLAGRFLMIVPVLAIAGSMAGKKVAPAGPGTFPTNGALFVFLLVAVVLVVGALTFFPALVLGPLVEHFESVAGRLF
jgi:K+-transporting ATPase ATPase A chain